MTCAHYALKIFGIYRLDALGRPGMRKLYVINAPSFSRNDSPGHDSKC